MNNMRKRIRSFICSLPPIARKRKKHIETMRSGYDYTKKFPSIISVNCAGGIIAHNMGFKFMSPTVNLWIKSSDFVKFVCNLKEYIDEELVEYKNTQYDYPVGKIKDILIYFNHYKSFEEAKEKWDARKKRIDYNNLYIIADDIGLDEKLIEKLENLECKRLVFFTAKERSEYKRAFCLRQYSKKGSLGLYSSLDLKGFAFFEKEFDYSAWLNGDKEFRLSEKRGAL